MKREEIDKFFEELKGNKEAQEALFSENAEDLESLAKATGGLASRLGYEFSDEEILAFYNEQEALLRQRSDLNADGISGVKDWYVTMLAGKKSCGARQEALRPMCKVSPTPWK